VQRFQFPLEQALKWRATCLDLENAKLARLRHERDRAARLRATVQADAQRESAAFRQRLRGTTGAELSILAGYRQGVAVRLKNLASTIARCEAQIEKQRAAVLEADREMRLLERLKQRQFEEWTYELSREIENTAAELFLANRRRASHG